jgi:excisionase family DNA binding protein
MFEDHSRLPARCRPPVRAGRSGDLARDATSPSPRDDLPAWVHDFAAPGTAAPSGNNDAEAFPADGSNAEAQISHFLTISDVAGELRISIKTVSRLLKRGDLKGMHIGRSVRIARGDLERFLGANNSTKSTR